MASAMGFVFHVVLLALVGTPTLVTALDVAYCSSQNTGSSFTPKTSTFQSNGLCQQTCNADYAFAILQGNMCWCSNYVPGDTTTKSDCSDSCPGYPSDKCGNEADGLFGYFEMTNHAPSGTASASSSSTAAETSHAESATSSAVPEIHTVTVTAPDAKPSTISSTVLSTTSSVSSTFSTSTTSSSSSTETSSTLAPSLSVETVAGQAATITVQNHPPTGTSSTSAASGHDSGSSLGGGAIAGIVIGTLAGAGVLLALLFWFCYARRRPGSSKGSESRYDPSIQNNLLDGRRQSKASQMSVMRNLFTEDSAARIPSSPTNLAAPAFTDNRMNKEAAIYPNGNRLSNVSLQDNQDYSRPVLRLTNPD